MNNEIQEFFSDIPQEIKLKIEELNSWRIERESLYGSLILQIEMLYDDIEDGVFGEQAKQGSWYQHVKGVKESVQKPDVETLES